MAAVFESLIDFLAKRPTFFAKLFECLGTELTDDFSYLNGQWFIDLLQFGPAAHLRYQMATFLCRLEFDPKKQILWPPKHPGRPRIRWPSRVHHQRIWLATQCRHSSRL